MNTTKSYDEIIKSKKAELSRLESSLRNIFGVPVPTNIIKKRISIVRDEIDELTNNMKSIKALVKAFKDADDVMFNV